MTLRSLACPILSAFSKGWGIVRGSKRPSFLHFLRAPTTLLLLLSVLACQPTAPQPAITTITISPEPLHTNVRRLGINLSGQSFYDSAQMLRNLTFRNPGFEGSTWQSILRCKTVTPTTCTDENQYTVWPANFLAGAHFEILNKSISGTVTSNTAAADNHGIILTLAAAPGHPAAAPGDFLLVRIDKPGNADAGWWITTNAGASVSTEFHDLHPFNFVSKQALHVEASGPSQSVAVNSYFDSMQGHSFVHLNTHLTLTFSAKSLSPRLSNQSVAVKLERLDTTHGLHTFFAKSIPLTTSWRDYTFDILASDIPGAVGTVGLTFTFAQTSALLDDVALTAAAAPNNPTAFRNEVVDTLRDLHPGVLRYMDSGANFGSSLDNMLAPPFGRLRTGASTQATLQEDIPLGLHEFLTLCQAVGAEPWYSMPPGTSPAEAANLIEYLSGGEYTSYGKLRSILGQPKPWTDVFPTIHLELGNEQWNARSFAGAAINDPTAYGQRATRIFTSMRAAPGFRASHFDLILGSWATVPWWSQQEIASSAAVDTLAVAPYIFNDFQDASTPEAIFGPMFAAPESIDSRPEGYMAQQARLLASNCQPTAEKLFAVGSSPSAHCTPNLAVYEVNLGALTGSAAITQSDLDRTIPSLGAGLAVADHMLLMLRDLGITTQCLFALPEYLNNFSAPGPKRMIPLWGAVVDMGGPTNLRRPQFLAEQLINQAILQNELPTHLAGPPHTWNQPESPNDKIKLADAHLLQTFAFADGPRHSLILLNLSRTETIPVLFAGLIKPSNQVEQSLLTSTNITDTNETTATVSTTHTHLPTFNPSTPYPLPAHSLTVLQWTQ